MPTQSLGFVSLAPRGDWDANITYKRLDIVNYGGSSYIVLKALTGVTPVGDNVNYMLLASKGDNAFQVWLLQPENEGKTYEDYEAWMRQPATEAGGRADEAANKAQGAADNANNAATTAQGAAQNANAAAEEARTNAALAKNEADAARDATTKAQEATNSANNAAASANTAAEKANEAAGTIDDKIGGMQDEIDKKADKTEIPTSLPANGGNADTVGEFGIDNLGKIINTAIADIDNMPGFFSSCWSIASAGTKPTDYGTVVQVVNKYGLPNSGEQIWAFQIAHAHGIDRPMWRRQTNGGGWTEWKQVALMDDIGSGGDNWYPTGMNWNSGRDYGPRLNLSGVGMAALSATIPLASVNESGVVNTIAQTFAGRKSFAVGIDIIAGGMSVNGGIEVDNGTISCTGEISAANGFYETSDIQLKKNITPVHLSGKRIRLCEFDKAGRHSYGVIAQEVEKLYPSTVKENEEGHKVVNYIEVLTIKCAEQDERIEALERENTSLKERLERLEKLLFK